MKHVSKNYLVLTVVYITCLLISNIAAVKTFTIGPLTLPTAVLLFPITYIVNDLLAEVYGYTKAKFTIYMGFAMNLLMVVYFQITIVLPAPGYYTLQDAYASILGNTPRLLIASMAAYLVGSTLNAKIMVTMRDVAKNGKGLFTRCILSTMAGELCDSIIFITVAFIGTMPLKSMIIMVFTQAAFKTLYEIVVFPLTNLVVKKVRAVEESCRCGCEKEAN